MMQMPNTTVSCKGDQVSCSFEFPMDTPIGEVVEYVIVPLLLSQSFSIEQIRDYIPESTV